MHRSSESSRVQSVAVPAGRREEGCSVGPGDSPVYSNEASERLRDAVVFDTGYHVDRHEAWGASTGIHQRRTAGQL